MLLSFFLHKRSCVLSLVPFSLYCFQKHIQGCCRILREIQLPAVEFCRRDLFLGFYGIPGYASALLHMFFFIPSIFRNFARNLHPFFLKCRILLSFNQPYVIFMHVIFVNDGCHLYMVCRVFTVSLVFFNLLIQSYILFSEVTVLQILFLLLFSILLQITPTIFLK